MSRVSRPLSHCFARGCRGVPRVEERTTILRGPERLPVTLTVYRCPNCGGVATPREERAKLSAPVQPPAG